MELINKLIWTIFHLSPESLNAFLNYVGLGKLYAILFIIVFAETGLVVTPFLPGDSLLFAIGVLGADSASPISLPVAFGLLMAATFLGDNTNYWIGYRVGPAVFRRENSRLLNNKHLLRAHAFYETYGAKTIILARFVPIVRTFAPFVAGIARMSYTRFLLFSIVSSGLWVTICMAAGYNLARVTFIRKHFDLVVVAIVLISVAPMVIEYIRHRKRVVNEIHSAASQTEANAAKSAKPGSSVG
jgi:membrane-associated protein